MSTARLALSGLFLAAACLAQTRLHTALVAGVSPAVAPGAAASLFGDNLASTTATGDAPYPMTLGGVTLEVTDNSGATRAARLLYVSPHQVNYIVPSGTGLGPALVRINHQDALSAAVQVNSVVPAIFTADADGHGVIAATAVRTVLATGGSFPVPVFQCDSPGNCASVPIDPGVDAPVKVTLYATGIHNRSRDTFVALNIGGTLVPISAIQSYDEDSALAGIDQLTFPLILTLRGMGEVDVILVADGIPSNFGRINIR
ncbi:MAG: hypothetical protein ABI806_06035 [Candidatus Solibacter sp.]